MLKTLSKHVLFAVALTCTGAAFADADPTLAQVYAAAEAGHVDQAQQMMTQVLRDHPNSAKAHYVAAELYAKKGSTSQARAELGTAERLEPGLPFAKPQAVQALKVELGSPQRTLQSVPGPAAGGSSFPWGIVLAVVAGLAVLWMVMRRRSPNVVYTQSSPMAASSGAPGTYGGPGVAGGMGTGIVGGLASGLAVGAGVVAGEELAHHFLDGDRHAGRELIPNETNVVDPTVNGDMGGSDFGVSDAGSWDDGGSAGGGDSDWS